MARYSKRQQKAYEEILRLQANRRKDIIKCSASLAAILVLVWGKLALELNGIIEAGNLVAGAVMMVSSVGLAIFAGSASIDFTKSGQYINSIYARTGLSKKDVKDRAKQQSRQNAQS
ncbi:MAG: hypothetical protein PEGG_00102 [Paraeggerthella hongkongensis]|uniref:hypothetical protein n=1 Tax=Paraeggerthella TaxID=651554 RepID=UPI000DF862DC|nr:MULTISPECIES: hypothetical protein [Paraeggerthella]MBU5405990.1 hypothetical protein [Paraeggerthella hongkongensis]MCD2433838.1 hypothetical protein [Paraeggerthella hominis]MDY3980164.1 hypothetical protein [Paraeggerthella sp.]RDB54499.1 hypothetical protein C1879_12060 [Paraeggerthella hongkongensis]